MKKIRLGDIATLITKGTTPTTIGFSFVDTGVNFVKIESISENGEFLSDKFAHITDECDNKLKRSQLEENDILFSIAGAIGRTAIVPRSILPANTNQALAIIRIPQNAFNLRFVLYALQSQAVEEQSEKQKQGVAQLNLSLKNIADILIPLVSSEKQDEIVRNLAAVDAAIAIRKEQIRLIDQLVKSRFVEFFGDIILNDKEWHTDSWNRIVKIVNGRNQKHVESKTGNYLICGSGGAMGRATEYLVKENSVIVGRKGNINKPILMREKYWNVDTAFGIEPNESIVNVDYLYMFCMFFDFERLNKAVTIPSLTKADLLEIKMPIPPMALQEQFAAFVEQADKSKLAVQKGLEELEILKKSLMQQYFG